MIVASNLRLYASLLIAGLMFPLGLAPFNLWPLIICSLSFLCLKIAGQSLSEVLSRVFLFNAGLFLFGVSWLYISIHYHGHVPAPFAMLATIAFCIFLAAVSTTPFLLWHLMQRARFTGLLGFPSLWVLGEWFRSWFATGFPWLFAGYSHQSTWLGGWAPLGGVLWLSFITCFIASVISQICRGCLTRFLAISCIGLAASSFLLGLLLMQINWTHPTESNLQVALIQPNIPQNQKWSPEKRRNILSSLERLSMNHWDKDIIIWPEAAIPAIAQNVRGFIDKLEARSLLSGNTLITGIPTFDEGKASYHNSVISIGSNPGQYDKTKLVPFGEYVPLENLLRGIINFFNLPMSNFSRGASAQKPLEIDGHNLSTAICYEVVYPDLVAKISRGSSMLLTVSNDAWFGDSLALPQHMQMAQMRALENAKPMLRATNNGLTAFIDYQGYLTSTLPPFTEGALVGNIQPRVGQTPFTIWGSWPCIVLCLIIVIILSQLKTSNNGIRGKT